MKIPSVSVVRASDWHIACSCVYKHRPVFGLFIATEETTLVGVDKLVVKCTHSHVVCHRVNVCSITCTSLPLSKYWVTQPVCCVQVLTTNYLRPDTCITQEHLHPPCIGERIEKPKVFETVRNLQHFIVEWTFKFFYSSRHFAGRFEYCLFDLICVPQFPGDWMTPNSKLGFHHSSCIAC